MFGSLSDFEGSLYDESRRRGRAVEQVVGRRPGPAGTVVGELGGRPGYRQGTWECGR